MNNSQRKVFVCFGFCFCPSQVKPFSLFVHSLGKVIFSWNTKWHLNKIESISFHFSRKIVLEASKWSFCLFLFSPFKNSIMCLYDFRIFCIKSHWRSWFPSVLKRENSAHGEYILEPRNKEWFGWDFLANSPIENSDLSEEQAKTCPQTCQCFCLGVEPIIARRTRKFFGLFTILEQQRSES